MLRRLEARARLADSICSLIEREGVVDGSNEPHQTASSAASPAALLEPSEGVRTTTLSASPSAPRPREAAGGGVLGGRGPFPVPLPLVPLLLSMPKTKVGDTVRPRAAELDADASAEAEASCLAPTGTAVVVRHKLQHLAFPFRADSRRTQLRSRGILSEELLNTWRKPKTDCR